MKNSEQRRVYARSLFTGTYVELPVMLDAREYRAWRQSALMKEYGKPLLCFTMNIAGPLKNNALIHQCFNKGTEDFRLQMQRTKHQIIKEEVISSIAGNEAFFVCDIDPYELKKLTCQLEDRDDIGRLYDMDVLFPSEDGSVHKIDREEIGGSARVCLICGKEGKDCASRRLHSVAELQQKTAEILYSSACERICSEIGEYAVRALLYEVSVTPKPGLVDRNNSGAHTDMNFYSFMNSSASLYPYFEACAREGMDHCEEDAKITMKHLRELGMQAENRMLKATAGVNTHKGAIFSLGILAASAARVKALSLKEGTEETNVFAVCREMTAGLTASDFAGITEENAVTYGQQLYVRYGITGARGILEDGLPMVEKEALPLLKKMMAEGVSIDEASTAVLLLLMSCVDDTSMIHRGSVDILKEEAQRAEKLLKEKAYENPEVLRMLDEEYISRHLSPGGCADLLAACWFIYTFEKENN